MDIRKESRVEVLRHTALSLHDENTRLRRELNRYRRGESAAAQRSLELENRLAQQARQLYGDSSERRGFRLGTKNKAPEPQRGHGRAEQQQLNIVDVVHELDAADLPCPKCGEELQTWAGHTEDSEEIDVVALQYVVKKHKRRKYRCGCGHIETALGAKKLQEKGRYSIDFAIDVAIKKHLEHLPLNRQVAIAERAGLDVTSQTLWDQTEVLASLLWPLKQRLLDYLHGKAVLGADETSWRLMTSRKGKKHYVWALCGDDAVLYDIANTRGANGAKPLLSGFRGRLMADDYAVYKSLAAASQFVFELDACWAHVRRKFIEAEGNEPLRAAAVVALIGEMYRLEKQAAGPPHSDEWHESLAKIRDSHTRSVVAALRCWAFEATDVLPESSFGQALKYMRNCFDRLDNFLNDGRIALDNNATERALRGIVVGRKNHYGSRSRRGCEVAALLYSLTESAKLAGVCPREYLSTAVHAAIDGTQIPLPHETRAES